MCAQLLAKPREGVLGAQLLARPREGVLGALVLLGCSFDQVSKGHRE